MDTNYTDFIKQLNTMNNWDEDVLKFDLDLEQPNTTNDLVSVDKKITLESFWSTKPNVFESDRVNHPAHYTSGKIEAIDIIEDAQKDALNPVLGALQGQVLKYVLRLWLKDNPLEDAEKARWYLNRLISKL